MAKITVDFDAKELKKKVASFHKEVNNRIATTMAYEAGYTTGWLKQNAPWTDDTGAARTGIMAMSMSSGTRHEILMAYSVYYGIWLEVANSGKYAVITPAMRIVGEKIMNDMTILIKSIFQGQ